ncbi:DnaA N-terminal domain-containing protein [Seohaeicola saemankumensis]|uniref:DnaA N-terminal domain-containing protein n=1 Tax=Seohaeicola saemankumensis TaxID=481181 RepID=A0ABW3THF2_9RHOB
MVSIKPVGRSAAVRKYDVLTAMGVHALSQDKALQRRILRLMTLITARYNWQRDELAVGQREIARMWFVDERTVKREMAQLRAMGWLVVRRQGARGHVTEYRLDISQIEADTRPVWNEVGPDFAQRMAGTPEQDDRVIPLPLRGAEVPAPDMSPGTEWALAQGMLHRADAALYGSWLRALTRTGRAGGRLTLKAPSRFHAAYVQTHLTSRILAACRAVDPEVSDVVIDC